MLDNIFACQRGKHKYLISIFFSMACKKQEQKLVEYNFFLMHWNNLCNFIIILKCIFMHIYHHCSTVCTVLGFDTAGSWSIPEQDQKIFQFDLNCRESEITRLEFEFNSVHLHSVYSYASRAVSLRKCFSLDMSSIGHRMYTRNLYIHILAAQHGDRSWFALDCSVTGFFFHNTYMYNVFVFRLLIAFLFVAIK